MSFEEDDANQTGRQHEQCDSEGAEIEDEYEDQPSDFEKLRPFDCPFCGKTIDWYGGECPHHVFSYELVNFEYTFIDSEFQEFALRRLHELSHNIEEMPCPLEPWAEYEDDEGDSHEMPSLDKVVLGLKLLKYIYHGPHGHGSWGVVVGFMEGHWRSGSLPTQP